MICMYVLIQLYFLFQLHSAIQMHTIKVISRSISLRYITQSYVSNISEKKFKYTFQVGSIRKIHPMRSLSDGTDRLLITPNLIAITDHGSGTIGEQYSQSIDGSYAEKLLKVVDSFFYNQIDKYIQKPMDLVTSAANVIKIQGNCTLTLVMTHPNTGEVVFYYIGDSLYGIFQQKQVTMVEGVYQNFNVPYRIGQYPATNGFVERYAYKDIKNDIILAATNGLWENVDLQSLHYEIRGPNSFEKYGQEEENARKEPKILKSIAQKIGYMAAFYSKKGNYQSPYYRRAKKQGTQVPKEGYLDDISVVLAKIQREVVIA